MRIASNKISDVKRFFYDELQNIYSKEEIEVFVEYCFEEFLNLKRIELTVSDDKTISESKLLKFNFAVKDLKNNKPIQHVLGMANFYGLKLKVNEDVLIPRQETEELVHLIIEENKNDKNALSILDVGTGSGCIPIALKNKLPTANVTAIDVSKKALAIASENAILNKVEIGFVEHDILSDKELATGKKYDIIVSNPPYVRNLEKEAMHKNVIDNEPHLALFVEDENPLLFYDVIANFALKHLNTSGKIYFEINEYLGSETKQLIVDKGFKNVSLLKDINGKNRILRGNI